MAFCSQIYAFLFLQKNWQLPKFESVDFRYDNSFFKIQIQKYPNKALVLIKKLKTVFVKLQPKNT